MGSPVLFVRVGWMEWYTGPRSGDEKPVGGGAYNRKMVGHEAFNFERFGNRFFGYFQPPNEGIRLEGIVANGGSLTSVPGVLVVYVATDPQRHGQRIVGWYQNATVYRSRQPYPPEVRQSITSKLDASGLNYETFTGFFAETDVTDATLLPTRRRSFRIPKKTGIGQANVCYPLDDRGSPKSAPWIDQASEFVESYQGENLVTDPYEEANADDSITAVLERRAGFQSNPAIRRAVEDLAMEAARSYLMGCRCNKIDNTSKTKPYDFKCERNGRTWFVEVKGTQTLGEAVVLTKNEKRNAEQNSMNSVLFVLHSIKVNTGKRPQASGGKERIIDPWDISQGSLKPSGWIYELPSQKA